jgi:hypothetical protein
MSDIGLNSLNLMSLVRILIKIQFRSHNGLFYFIFSLSKVTSDLGLCKRADKERADRKKGRQQKGRQAERADKKRADRKRGRQEKGPTHFFNE